MNLLDKNDPTDKKVKNYAVLMFSDRPDKFINHAYVELIAYSPYLKKNIVLNKYTMDITAAEPTAKIYYNVISMLSGGSSEYQGASLFTDGKLTVYIFVWGCYCGFLLGGQIPVW